MIDPIIMYHPSLPGDENYRVERQAYRETWYAKGWRSDDDPEFTGTLPGPAPGVFSAGPFYAAQDSTLIGGIKTGTFGQPPTFEGIEREARCFAGGRLLSPTGVWNFGDDVPRINMPRNVRTDVFVVIEVEEWWLQKPDGNPGTIGIYFEWVNDHTAGGNVRWDCAIREFDIGQDVLSGGGDLLSSRTYTQAAPSPNVSTTGIAHSIASGNPVEFDPGPLAAFYVLRISRLGNDDLDTLEGPVGFVATNMTRGQ